MNRELSAEFRKRFSKVTEKESYAWSWRISPTISDIPQAEMMQVGDCVDMVQSTNMTSNVPAIPAVPAVAADDDNGWWSYNESYEDGLLDKWSPN
jgi:hypothetical protein